MNNLHKRKGGGKDLNLIKKLYLFAIETQLMITVVIGNFIYIWPQK